MKTVTQAAKPHRHSGLTLVEMTVVIAVLLLLAGVVTFSINGIGEWKAGREAAEDLKSVLVAQRSYLADHPTKGATDLTTTLITPYLPKSQSALPSGTSLDGDSLTLKVDVIPPVFQLSGNNYDPSSSTSDGLWDVGGL